MTCATWSRGAVERTMPLFPRRFGIPGTKNGPAAGQHHHRTTANGVAVRTELEDGRQYTLALRPGTSLDGIYRITQVLSQSSTFAVTYLTQDERAGDQVVIKEFLPRTLAGRAPDELTVLPHSADNQSTFSRALRRFLREAEVLADIAHPHIPRVRRAFEANGTAYIVLEHHEGKTLTEHLTDPGDRFPADYAVALVLQVLHGLGALHAEGIIHGYITPDNILVDVNSRALILGLGTTRHVVGPGREPVAGFAPIEQYAAREVGPWTDVYACAAVLYRLTTGLTPPSAVERSAGQMVTLPTAAATSLPPALGRTVMTALSQLPDTRPHSAEEFRRRLDVSVALGAEAVAPRVDHQPNNGRWATPVPVPPAIDGPTGAELQPKSRRYDDEVVFLPPDDGPPDGVGRLIRRVLGIGGAAAGTLLVVSVLGGRQDEWPGGNVVAASPALTTKARASAITTSAPPVEKDSLPQPAGEVLGAPRAVPQPPREQPSIDPARSAASTQVETPPRVSRIPATRSAAPHSVPPAQAMPKTVTQAGASGTPSRARTTPTTATAGPPSITVALAPTVGQFELLPSEVLTGLRERLAHGKENNEFGEYATARRIYRGALDQIAKLGDRYAGSQALVSLKKELEQAGDRALAACAAENEVIRRRNGKAMQCD
jgi:serine/threonine protein kinase